MAFVFDPSTIRRIPSHLGLRTEPYAFDPARSPPQTQLDWQHSHKPGKPPVFHIIPVSLPQINRGRPGLRVYRGPEGPSHRVSCPQNLRHHTRSRLLITTIDPAGSSGELRAFPDSKAPPTLNPNTTQKLSFEFLYPFHRKPSGCIQDEVKEILNVSRRPFLELADDNTFASKSHGRQVADALRPFGLRWFTETDVSFGEDVELVARAADAGYVQVLIGLESPTEPRLRGIEIKRDWKAAQAGRYLRAIDAIQSRGISVNGCFVLGLDGAGEESFDEVLDFVKASGLHEVQVTVQTPFPGTPLYSRLEGEGRLLACNAWDRCTLFDVTFMPTDMTVQQLRVGLRRLVSEIYSDEAVAKRRAQFRARRS